MIGCSWGGTFNYPVSTHWLIDCALAQYILSYISKTQKGMSSIMDKACDEAFTNCPSLKNLSDI